MIAILQDKPAAPAPDPHRGAARPAGGRGTAGFWALLGALWVALAAEVWVRWILSSSQFSPAPIHSADHYAAWRLISLRTTEALSAVVFVWLLYVTVIKPRRRTGSLTLDGKIFLGCLIGCITDGVLNVLKYIFAWNAHSVNLGSWSSFLPFHQASSNPRYAEALIWGVPMYIYFCIGVAVAGMAIVTRLRARFPAISNASALSVVFLAACVLDFVLENAIIRSTQAYAFARAPSSVTLFAGRAYQFPIYETLCVAALGTIFTALRLGAADGDGVSFVERGYERFPPGLRSAVRLVAVIGFCITTLFVVYHLPVNWLGTNGASVAPLPSYLLP